MSSRSRQIENYARECVNLAALAKARPVRDKLIALARDWMQAAMDEEDRPSPAAMLS
jgi:hypothetical protein